uniref:hypothetical protein n=1 Tax=Agrobacterium tumefaciens TaxID=358 RepID=UPI001AD9387C
KCKTTQVRLLQCDDLIAIGLVRSGWIFTAPQEYVERAVRRWSHQIGKLTYLHHSREMLAKLTQQLQSIRGQNLVGLDGFGGEKRRRRGTRDGYY